MFKGRGWLGDGMFRLLERSPFGGVKLTRVKSYVARLFSWYNHLGYQHKLQMFLRYENIMVVTMKTTVLYETTLSIVVRYGYFGIAYCLSHKGMIVADIKPN